MGPGDMDRVDWLKALLYGYTFGFVFFYLSIRYNRHQVTDDYQLPRTILLEAFSSTPLAAPPSFPRPFCSSCSTTRLHLSQNVAGERRGSFPYYYGDVMDRTFNETASP